MSLGLPPCTGFRGGGTVRPCHTANPTILLLHSIRSAQGAILVQCRMVEEARPVPEAQLRWIEIELAHRLLVEDVVVASIWGEQFRCGSTAFDASTSIPDTFWLFRTVKA
jgi:hypothetical protein